MPSASIISALVVAREIRRSSASSGERGGLLGTSIGFALRGIEFHPCGDMLLWSSTEIQVRPRDSSNPSRRGKEHTRKRVECESRGLVRIPTENTPPGQI